MKTSSHNYNTAIAMKLSGDGRLGQYADGSQLVGLDGPAQIVGENSLGLNLFAR